MSQTAPSPSPLEEVADFFAGGPSVTEIARFHLSDAALDWINDLLEREDDGTLSADERRQLDELLVVNDLVALIRSRASAPGPSAPSAGDTA
ncbi:MAG TPA: hypothetical protein VF725_05800 [Ktedonobacterales bacterium]